MTKPELSFRANINTLKPVSALGGARGPFRNCIFTKTNLLDIAKEGFEITLRYCEDDQAKLALAEEIKQIQNDMAAKQLAIAATIRKPAPVINPDEAAATNFLKEVENMDVITPDHNPTFIHENNINNNTGILETGGNLAAPASELIPTTTADYSDDLHDLQTGFDAAVNENVPEHTEITRVNKQKNNNRR